MEVSEVTSGSRRVGLAPPATHLCRRFAHSRRPLTPTQLSVCLAARNTFKLLRYNSNHTILSGGSLGSWVDEERSQLRELM
jgi:hypothetical protein